MNQNLNSLVSRMLANAKQQQQPATTGPTTTNNNNIKRNLFGIHLNHDQLKQDLNEMWQDQLERKKREWNFDFESLKPIEKINNNNNNESRYEWNQVKTTNLNQTNSDLVLTTFDSSELFSDDDHEEEEDDEALAMPAFYKYQRRQKLNGFKFIQIEQPTTTKIVKQQQQQQTAFSKLKQQSNNNKPNNRCLHKPKPVKQTTKASKQNLIITLSENRKDTLRSAVASTSSSSSKRDLTNKSSKSAFKQPNIKSSSIESTPMKQQSLLDMLKQRKRKTPSTSNTIAKITDSSNNTSSTNNNNNNIASCISGLGNSIVHNLRPRTISFN